MNPLATLITWLYIISAVGAEFVSMCYFTNWAYERPIPSARFSIKDIDPHLCSHLIYAFVNIDPKGLVLKSSSQFEESRYEEFNKLKIKNKHLKTLMSVGGQHAKSDVFTALSSQPKTIQHFAKTSAKFLRDREFDGIDIDWEYPGETENTKHQFTKLLMGLREEFELEAKESGKERLVITIAVPAGKERIDDGYEVEQISRYVDYIDIMAYDYFGPWNKISGFNSPLFPRFSNPKFSKELNMKWTVDEWLRKKAPREKIVVGMTGAGCSFTLNDTKSHDVGDLVDGGGVKGKLYLLEGRLIYPEICDMNDAGGTEVYDEEQNVPYLYKDDQWVGFDNIRSIQAKVNWMIKEGLAGAMFWTLDFDDFSGKFCRKDKFPLLNAIKNEIAKNSVHPVLNKVVPKPVISPPGGMGPDVSYCSLLLMVPLAFSLAQIFH